jgi:hypothetical protein
MDHLCWVYDNNHITIEGPTSLAFTEDVAGRFLAYGWNVLRVGDANDLGRIQHALGVFHSTRGRPSLIILDSHIGYGAPHKQDTAAAHGEPLGEEEVRLTKRSYGWPEEAQFLVPDGSANTSPPALARAAPPFATDGPLSSDRTVLSTRSSRLRSTRCNDETCRPGGIAISVFPADAKGNRRPRCLGPSAQRARAQHPMAPGGLGGSGIVEQDHAERAVIVEGTGLRRHVLHLQ